MAHATPHVSDGVLILHAKTTEECRIPVESAAWWDWLANASVTTFQFKSDQGSFTARREQKGGHRYWYAYHKRHGKLHKAYLGKSEELTQSHLGAIAAHLSEAAEPTETQIANTVTTTHRDNNDPSIIHRAASGLSPQDIQRDLLINTKFYQPPTRPELVARPQLIERLDAGMQRKLTLISAPAGFGKTTLVSSWCSAQHTHLRHTWLSLDAGDNDPSRFWSYVTAALQRVHPAVKEQVMPLLHLLPAPPIESILTVLINILADLTDDLILILDDYHVITTQAIHDAVTFFLNYLPPHMHVLIASRSDPPLPLMHLRAQGQLSELRATDLRFSYDEVTAFLKQATGLVLSHTEIVRLDAHTEGWIAGLQLAAHSMRGHKDIGEFIAAFTGNHRYILDYLTDEVLNWQPAHIRDFLLQTSILERLSASLCDTITQRSDGQAMLEYLEQANLFLVPLDEQRQWYRYHQLFAEFLRNRLHQTHPELAPLLHKRASAWYEQHGLISAPIDHALATADMEHVAQLAERFAQTMLMRGEITTFLNWLGALPEKVIRSHPRLRLSQVAALISVGQLDLAKAYLQEVESVLNILKSTRRTEPADIQSLEGDFFTAHIALAGFSGDVARTIELSQQSSNLLPTDSVFLRSIIAVSKGNAYLMTGDFAKASTAYAEAIKVGDFIENRHAVLASMAAQGYVQAAQGHLHQAAETYKETIHLGTRQGGRLFSAISIVYTFLAELFYEWNKLDEAERYAREGAELGKHWGFVGMLGGGYITQARVQQARGNHEEALTMAREAEHLASGYSFSHFAATVTASRAVIQLHAGHSAAALQWAQSVGLREDEALTHFRELELLILAEVHISQGQFTEASKIVERLLPVAESAGRARTVIECLILQALLLLAQSNMEQAMSTLAKVLSIAEPEGYIRIFLDKGEPLMKLLRSAMARGIAPTYIHKLLIAEAADASAPGTGWLLSEREVDILRSIAAGKSNQEIAQEFVIALSTVKTHINNIYAKLGVHSRTQAIARAKGLRLL